MSNMNFFKRYPLLTYFVLTFALSWGGILLFIGGPDAIPSPSEQAMKLLPVAILVMLVGPSVAGLLLTGFVHGRAALASCWLICSSGGLALVGMRSRS